MKVQISGEGFLPDIERLLNEVCGDPRGSEVLKRLCKSYQGEKIEIPNMTKLYRQRRDEQIRAAFNGENFLELADEWGLTERWVRELITGIK